MAGMKWKLNLNQAGPKLLCWVGLFLVVIPAVSWGAAWGLGPAHAWRGMLWQISLGSRLLGLALLVGLLFLLVIEAVQGNYQNWASGREPEQDQSEHDLPGQLPPG